MTNDLTRGILIICLIIVGMNWLCSRPQEMKHSPYLARIIQKIEPMFRQNKTYTGSLSVLNDRNPLREISIYSSRTSSYAVNKNEIYILVYDNERQEYYDENTLIHVILHELAHVLCDEIGHTEKYYKIFNELLSEAISMNIYDPTQPINKLYPTSN